MDEGGYFVISGAGYIDQSTFFVLAVIGISVLFMLITIVVWIRQLLQGKKSKRPFAIQKLVGLAFIIVFFTFLGSFLNAVTDYHPDLGAPKMFLEISSSSMNLLLVLAIVLFALSIMMVILCVYSWIKKSGSLGQRIHYTVLTLLSIALIWILWSWNF